MFEYKLEYYLYNREDDKFIYDWNFKKLYKMYEQLDSHEKVLGVAIVDKYGSTMEEDVLFEYKE